jgi:uncharacterized membrane protein YkoI
MLTPIRRTAMAVVAIGALGLGGSAIAGAADNGSSPASGTSSSTATQTRDHGPRPALSADAAAKVKAAALAKVPGATVLETEAGGPNGAAYHAHIRTSDGKLQVVLVNASFQATAVQADDGRGAGPRGGHGGQGHGAETALTGDTKSKVEAAVLAKYPGATIERTETNTDGSAPYESHIKTSAGTELEVHVSKDFAVTDAQQHPAHP